MEDWHTGRLDGLQKAIDAKVNIFSGRPGIVTRLKRWDYGGIFGRDDFKPKCGSEKVQTRMDERVELLKKFHQGLKPIKSDLKMY